MSLIMSPRTMTTEELESLPEDGIDRELIRGQLREKPMTRRNRWHSTVEVSIAHFLRNWLDSQPKPLGLVVGGEAGFRLRRNPDSTVGIDVAFVSAEVAANEPDATYFEGAPVLAVEILSPSDKQEEIDEKVELYLETGVAIVWVVNPRFRTVVVFRAHSAPEMFNEHQELTAEPHLPGFRISVARLFAS
ncbi:MAG TPA: Uma2 family endonuclease [Myxococcota bacterium]|nr:Uma2 family endonuclease [Myxococcota bacterium]